MSDPQYRVLRVVLGFLSLLMAIAGVILIFSSKSLILRLFLHPPEAEISTLLLAALKEMGGLALMIGIMLFFATRDPERNVAIVDALMVGLCVLTVTPLISLYTLDVGRLYPAYAVWGRSLARLAVAALLFFLRPRKGGWKPAGSL
jgi:Na+-driven multidrug efflux pump